METSQGKGRGGGITVGKGDGNGVSRRCGVSREPGESQMRLGASLFLREGKKRARLCCARRGWFKVGEQSWWRKEIFARGSKYSEMLKRDVYREKLPNTNI